MGCGRVGWGSRNGSEQGGRFAGGARVGGGEATAQAAVDGRLPGGPGVRLVHLDDQFEPRLHVLAGIFGRKDGRRRYDASHPLNLFWNAFTAHLAARPT